MTLLQQFINKWGCNIVCFLQSKSSNIVQQWYTCLAYNCFVKGLTDCTYKILYVQNIISLQLKYLKLKVPVTSESSLAQPDLSAKRKGLVTITGSTCVTATTVAVPIRMQYFVN